MKIMKGIYKIVTPTGSVYIGQSTNIKARWKDHRSPRTGTNYRIGNSIKKYGWREHHFEVIHELPEDIDSNTMCVYESFYINQYRECGFTILNIADVRGSNHGYKPSEETRRLSSERNKGQPSHWKGQKHTEESRKIMSEKAKSRVRKKGYKREGFIPWSKGKKLGDIGKRKGCVVSQETREKLRIAGLGKKLSPETIAKRTASVKARTTPRKRMSEESRKRQSEKMKGRKASMETRQKMSLSQTKRHANALP